MRVGVDYRFLAVGPGLITRGICRYTQQQLREVLAADDTDEFVLLCNTGTDLSLIDADVRDADNVEIRCWTPPRDLSLGASEDALAAGAHYQDWIYEQGIDVYHATSPFLPEEPRLLRFDACPMVATFYDVIPMLFPEHYPIDHRQGEYARLLRFVKSANRLVAISDAARNDAVNYLGVARDRIDRAWPIPDEAFRPLSARMLDKLLLVLRSRIRLPERYVLTVSALHHAKNLATLLDGYALLPRGLRSGMPLVVCCFLDRAGEIELRRLAAEAGIEDDIVVTGHVSDVELCALYNRATLVAHPSRYEGFGLPVVEAMRCGAPVVTTSASSLPEVAGDAAVLVDPEDPRAFADAIARLAGDSDARETLRMLGFEQAKRFDAGQLARGTLESYRRALDPAEPSGRLRLAVWSPLPPQQSGIADYTAELLDGLAPHCDLEVFVDGGYLPDADLMGRHRIQHHSAFRRRAAQQPFDAIVYQVGASVFHDYMSEALATQPGIVVLHDLAWSPVLYARAHRCGDIGAFHREVLTLHGRRALDELRALEYSGDERIWDFLVRHPMMEPVIGASLAQVVLLPAAAGELRAIYPGTSPRVVPMGVADPYDGNPGMSRDTARCQLGLDPDGFVAGVFGIVHPVKRLEVCIRALGRVAESRPDAVLLVVGRALEQRYLDDLGKLAVELGVATQVRFTGHVPRHGFDASLVASDVVVNLRVPVHKHMSATVMRGIAAGKPIVLTDLPEWRVLPDAFCHRVPEGGGEETALVRALQELADDPGERLRMSIAARRFYEHEGTVERMASRYLEVAEDVRAARARTAPELVGVAP